MRTLAVKLAAETSASITPRRWCAGDELLKGKGATAIGP
jgi:hypothetical protein